MDHFRAAEHIFFGVLLGEGVLKTFRHGSAPQRLPDNRFKACLLAPKANPEAENLKDDPDQPSFKLSCLYNFSSGAPEQPATLKKEKKIHPGKTCRAPTRVENRKNTFKNHVKTISQRRFCPKNIQNLAAIEHFGRDHGTVSPRRSNPFLKKLGAFPQSQGSNQLVALGISSISGLPWAKSAEN